MAENDGRRWQILVLLGTAYFMTILDGTGLLTALPTIERGLHLAGGSVQWTVTSYALAFSGPLLFTGRAADRLGRKRLFLFGMALRVLSSLLCGFAPSATVLVATRAVQGLSAAIIAPAALSMVLGAFPDGAQRNRALGIWGGLGGFGATAGLLVGGVLTQALGWSWVFWINVPIGVAVLVIAPALLPGNQPRDRARSFDLPGALTATAALILLVLTIIRIPTANWAAPTSWLPLPAIAVLLGAFVLVERRAVDPLLPPRLLRNPLLRKGNLLLLIAGMSVDGVLVTLTGYVQQVLGWSALRFGVVAMVMTVTSVAGGLLAQRVVTRFGTRPVVITGVTLLAGACVLLEGGSLVIVLVALFAFGAGMGATAVGAQITALGGIPATDSGIGAGLADTSFTVGTALGVAICTSVPAAVLGTTSAITGERLGFGVAAVFGAVGIVVALSLGRSSRQRGPVRRRGQSRTQRMLTAARPERRAAGVASSTGAGAATGSTGGVSSQAAR
jgi:EmrB/QacA subfamily drug resistance transporter